MGRKVEGKKQINTQTTHKQTNKNTEQQTPQHFGDSHMSGL